MTINKLVSIPANMNLCLEDIQELYHIGEDCPRSFSDYELKKLGVQKGNKLTIGAMYEAGGIVWFDLLVITPNTLKRR